MSDTPETDACLSTARGESLEDLCKRLERERDEAMELASLVGNHPIATPCRDSCRDHEIEGWKNKWECAVEMAARAENTVNTLINLIADIRVAVGDKEGKLTQDELVEHCRMLKREYDRSY
jgi:benzoyl-CoA reductase/2-hydroxyglutaryl-CoA dehydratase subunit BcrC/BadD/HgdB